MRRLLYCLVESGACGQCGRRAEFHAVDGVCSPNSAHLRHRDVPEPCYSGLQGYAFVDLDSPEARVIAHRVAADGAIGG